MNKKLFLLDAYALIFRAYYAFIRNPRINSKGLNTSAIFGFVNTLMDVLQKEKPTHIAVAFDPPGPTFRVGMYPEYKANREATPEDIKAAVPYIKAILEGFNIPILEVQGFEADDVIGTLANKAEAKGFTTFMMTPDKDYCQLVTDKTFIYKPKKSGNDAEIWGKEEVRQNFGIADPKQVIDVLALWGDASDNVPGVPGIGEKTAKKLIAEFGSIESLYHNINKLSDRQKKSLEETKDQLALSRQLVTIALDVPVDLDEEALIIEQPDKEKLKTIFEELEFRTVARRLLDANYSENIKPEARIPVASDLPLQGNLFETAEIQKPSTNFQSIKTVDHQYFLVQSEQETDNLLKKLQQANAFCFDTETTNIDPMLADLVGISFSVKAHEAYFVLFPTNYQDACTLADRFKPVFADKTKLKIGQNMKFDMLVLSHYDIQVDGPLFDTMIAHYLLQPDLRHNLNYLSEIYLNYLPIPIEDLIGKKGVSQISMRLVDPLRLCDYASEDADVTLQIYEILSEQLKGSPLEKLFNEIEMPLVKVLFCMELQGVRIDEKALKILSAELKNELISLEEEITRMAGLKFNLNSPKQLGDVLFNRLKISSDNKLTKTKQYSTSEETLQKLVDKHPIIEKILDFRSVQKLVSTYVDALPSIVNPRTRRIHTSFNQAIAATGRLSSNNPNLQNIPIREARGREIRRAFIPTATDHLFVSADYSQIELRLMAHLSDDDAMIEAFRNNADIHTATAARIYKIAESEVTREMRTRAKTANFGIIYGISSFGLAQRLGISRSEARTLIDGYFETYPAVQKYMETSIAKAREQGYVETLFGRRRMLPDINSRNAIVRGMAERNAINAPIQGSAADIIKIAMNRIFACFSKEKINSKMILQVHDELDFDVFPNELEIVKNIIGREMENATELKVPLTVDIGTGTNWLEAH